MRDEREPLPLRVQDASHLKVRGKIPLQRGRVESRVNPDDRPLAAVHPTRREIFCTSGDGQTLRKVSLGERSVKATEISRILPPVDPTTDVVFERQRVCALLYLTSLDVLVLCTEGSTVVHVLAAEDYAMLTVLSPLAAAGQHFEGVVAGCADAGQNTVFFGGRAGSLAGFRLSATRIQAPPATPASRSSQVLT